MAPSGDTTFDLSADEVVSLALANVGAVGPGKTATGAMRDDARRRLNMVVKAIDADGDFLWRAVRRTQSTTSGTAAYTLGTDVYDLDEPLNYKRAALNSRAPIRLMSRDDFMSLSDRTTSGVPTMAFVERTLPTTVTLTVWPVPDATGDSIEYGAMLRAQDYDTGANTGDFPSRWLNCLLYGLTAELAPAYRQPQLMTLMERKFMAEKERQLGAGAERGRLVLVPWGGFYDG